MKLTVGWLYPDLMSTYGDRGNIIVLKKRCEWRDIECEIKTITLETPVSELKSCDLLSMGGAQDRQQKIASDDLRGNKGPVLKEMIENGTPGLFVCAAYQFMGNYYRPAEGEDIKGLGIFDLYTQHFGKDKPRCIGDLVIQLNNELDDLRNTLVGFENHGGRTYLGSDVKPLGKVLHGFGNNGEDKTEGAIYKNAYGSYSHGPILSKNPHFADLLISLALRRKYKDHINLHQLDDDLEWQAHDVIIRRYNIAS